jgi:ABC-2 type transport system ATP-binding protein
MSARPPGSVLFSLDGAEVELPDSTRLGPLTARADASRLVLVGDWAVWFDALEGTLRFRSGRAEISGVGLDTAIRAGVAGLAPLDPPLPKAWTVSAYLARSASLLGHDRRATAALVAATFARFELEHLTKRALGSLRVAERRVLSLANAVLHAPAVLCCEAPLHRLDNAAQAYVEAALERAAEGRRSIVSMLRLPPLGRERALAERADQVLELGGGHVAPLNLHEPGAASASRFLVTVSTDVRAFCDALSAAGLTVERLGSVVAYRALDPAGADFQRIAVSATGGLAAGAILRIADAARAGVVELIPD